MVKYIFILFSIVFTANSLTGYSQSAGYFQEGYSELSYPKKEVVVINSGYEEARPLISNDGNALYFSRRYHPKNSKGEKDFQDVWVSYLDTLTDQWSEPENLGPVINNKKRNAIASLSPDGMDGIFFNTYKKTKRMPLVRSRKSGDTWTKPRVLNIDNFVNVSDYADYFVDFENKVLILAIQADSTVGDQDLYVSFLDPYGGWKEPVNIGAVVNTEKAEFAPFIGSDNRFLFFCSYGHNSLGKSDIYVSVRLDNSWLKWSAPVNLGPAINSVNEETYFSITGDYSYLYYTSYPSNSKDRNISRVELPEDFLAFHGPVLAGLDSNSLEQVRLSGLYNLPSAGVTSAAVAVNSGEGSENIKPSVAENAALEEVVAGEIEKALTEGRVADRAENSVAGKKEQPAPLNTLSPAAEELKNYLSAAFPDLTLELRQKQDTVEFKIVENLLYEFNSVFVKPEYLQRLSKMARVLRERPDLKVQLIGHTDNSGSEEVNKKIALQRVENLVLYLKDRKVSPNRIEIIGAGQAVPLAGNDSEEGRLQNRRVETIIRFLEK